MIVSSAIQIPVLFGLVVLGLCGNIGSHVLVTRTNLKCLHISLLAVLDMLITLTGPGIMLLCLFIGPNWLEHNRLFCQGLAIFSTWMILGCFSVLFSFSVSFQNVRSEVRPAERRRKKDVLLLAASLLTSVVFCIIHYMGWSFLSGVSLSCTPLLRVNIPITSNYALFYLLCTLSIHSIAIVLSVRATKRCLLYPMQLLWKRHLFETKINDPEVTTTTISSAGSKISKIGVKTSWSRQSSFSVLSGRWPGTITASNTPVMSRKTSQQPPKLEGTLLNFLSAAASNAIQLNNRGDTGNAQEDNIETGPKEEEIASTSRGKNPEGATATVSNAQHTAPDPFVIPLKSQHSLPTLPGRKYVFQSPKTVPNFTSLQKQRSSSRFMLFRCCVSLICWIPMYILAFLQMFSVTYSQELYSVIQCLLYLPSSISPLLLMCDASYRQTCQRAVFYVFRVCLRRNKKQVKLSQSRDVELTVESTEQVKLRKVTELAT